MKKNFVKAFILIALSVLIGFMGSSIVVAIHVPEHDYLYQVNRFAAQVNINPISISSSETIMDLNGFKNYQLLKFTGDGYAIISLVSSEIIEISFDGICPYNDTSGDKYYGGPNNYAFMNSNNQVACARTNQIVDISRLKEVADECDSNEKKSSLNESQVSGQVETAVTLSSSYFSVSYADYIKYSLPFGNNVNGTCGSVASGMMLTCHDRYVCGIGRVVPLLLPYGEPLHQSLIPYIETALFGGSTPATIKAGINNWFDYNEAAYGLLRIGTARYVYAVHDSYIYGQLSNGKTCVVALGSALGSPYGNHIVMAYGYNGLSNPHYYRTHLGGSGSSDVWINAVWTSGASWVNY